MYIRTLFTSLISIMSLIQSIALKVLAYASGDIAFK
jgi:hypothetical protein